MKLIKEFAFVESNRSRLTFTSSEVRLVPNRHYLELKADAGAFPLGDDYRIRTWLTNPGNAKQWLSFQADVKTPSETSVGFRLSKDGTNDLWWDGAAWSVPTSGDWSTEEDLATNIGALQIAPEQAIQVVVNLKTLNVSRTPSVSRLKILYESDLNFQEDYLVKSLARDLREKLRPRAMFAKEATTEFETVDLDEVDKSYKIVGVAAAYNTSNDPKRLVNLALSYDVGSKVLTLDDEIQIGERVEVQFIYEPEVSVVASQDYTELARVPAIVIEAILVEKSSTIARGEHVVNKTTGQAWQLQDGYQANIAFDLRMISGAERDQQILSDELKRYFSNNRFLRSRGQDELFPLELLDVYAQQARANQTGLHTSRLRARVANAVFYLRDTVDTFGVLQFNITGGNLNLSVTPI